MVHTSWQWIIPGQLKEEETLLNNIPPNNCQSSSFYYTSTLMIQKNRGHWNYVSALRTNLSQLQTHYIDTVLCYPKLFRSKLTLMLENKVKKQNSLQVTVIEETEVTTEPPKYHSEIILYRTKKTNFVTSANFTPSQLELTYVFSLKLKGFDSVVHNHNSRRSRAVYWIYRC